MKKTYIAPVAEIYKANLQAILAASPAFKDGEVMSGEIKENSGWDMWEDE